MVLLRAIDCCDNRFIRLDATLLEGVQCRTALKIKYDPPDFLTDSHEPVYNSWMRYDLLVAFVQTLVTHRLCFSYCNVSFMELTEAFEFEGGFSLSGSKRNCELGIIKGPPLRPGLATRKRKSDDLDALKWVFDCAANAFASWYRLQHAFDYNINTRTNCKPPNFDCSSTRALIKILNPPDKMAETTGDFTFDLCSRKACWLISILTSFGVLRNELIESKQHSKDDYSSRAFDLLQRKIETDPCGPFLCVLGDGPRCCFKSVFFGTSSSGAQRPLNPSTFANDTVATVLGFGSLASDNAETSISKTNCMPPNVKFSRAVVNFAFKIVKISPRLGSMLSLACSTCPSNERSLFESSLAKHGLKVCAWSPSEMKFGTQTPLLFPPSLKNLSYSVNRNACPSFVIECTL